MKSSLILLSFALSMPVYGQTMYKCPSPSGTINFQQTPCQGGEEQQAKPITSGQGTGLSENALNYLRSQLEERAAAAAFAVEEAKRREALNVERDKVKAADEQAAALREQNRILAAPRVITIHRR